MEMVKIAKTSESSGETLRMRMRIRKVSSEPSLQRVAITKFGSIRGIKTKTEKFAYRMFKESHDGRRKLP